VGKFSQLLRRKSLGKPIEKIFLMAYFRCFICNKDPKKMINSIVFGVPC
jgi:hypothetical protein